MIHIIKIFRKGNGFINYAIISMETSFYLFGGEDRRYGNSNGIFSFSSVTKQWKTVGRLNFARSHHGAIFHLGEFVIVGGEYG